MVNSKHKYNFVSSWETGLQIHMTKKHSMVEQVDENATLTDDDLVEDDKYSDDCHYWETGLLGTAFQTFLDANNIIDTSNLSEVIKDIEKATVLEAKSVHLVITTSMCRLGIKSGDCFLLFFISSCFSSSPSSSSLETVFPAQTNSLI